MGGEIVVTILMLSHRSGRWQGLLCGIERSLLIGGRSTGQEESYVASCALLPFYHQLFEFLNLQHRRQLMEPNKVSLHLFGSALLLVDIRDVTSKENALARH